MISFGQILSFYGFIHLVERAGIKQVKADCNGGLLLATSFGGIVQSK
jgi:hypothetical protein